MSDESLRELLTYWAIELQDTWRIVNDMWNVVSSNAGEIEGYQAYQTAREAFSSCLTAITLPPERFLSLTGVQILQLSESYRELGASFNPLYQTLQSSDIDTAKLLADIDGVIAALHEIQNGFPMEDP